MNDINIYIYNFKIQSWEKIYSFSFVPEIHFNCVWGVNDNIYFDTSIAFESETRENEFIYNIKKYDLKTGEVSNFLENARILNASQNDRYLTYIDFTNNKTNIIDLESNNIYEIPLTKELEWYTNRNEFVSLEVGKETYISVHSISDNNKINISKFNIDDYINDDEEIFNLQIVNDKIQFDVIDYEGFNGGGVNYITEIKKVTTYEIKENK